MAQKNYDFINKQSYMDSVVRILTKYAEDNFSNERFYDSICDEEGIEEYAHYIVEDMAESMKEYCNRDSQRIIGNFCNASDDWDGWSTPSRESPSDKTGVKFKEVVEMINGGIVNDATNFFRDWAVSWMFEAFGTYGMTYNFGNYLSEKFYELEQETDTFYELQQNDEEDEEEEDDML